MIILYIKAERIIFSHGKKRMRPFFVRFVYALMLNNKKEKGRGLFLSYFVYAFHACYSLPINKKIREKIKSFQITTFFFIIGVKSINN